MQAKVLSGIDQLHLMDQIFSGKRLAVVTGGGAVNRDLVSTLDVLTSRYQVVKLFNTIYGIRGEFRYGEDIPYYVDEKTGLGVHSIFNIERTAPTEEMTFCDCVSPKRRTMRSACLLTASIDLSSGVLVSSASPV